MQYLTISGLSLGDELAALAGIIGAIMVIWTFISRVRNSGKAEVEVRIADLQHEQEQNEKIKDNEQAINHIKTEIELLKKQLKDVEGAKGRLDRLEKQLDELLILLADANSTR